jgi:hypothetical protein
VTKATDLASEPIYWASILSVKGHDSVLLTGHHQPQQLTIVLEARVVYVHLRQAPVFLDARYCSG